MGKKIEKLTREQAHSIKTPLYAIMGTAENLKNKIDRDANPEQYNELMILYNNSCQLAETINSVFDLPKQEYLFNINQKNNINPKDYTIFIVDDNPVNLMILEEQISSFEYQTFTAASGEELLRRLDEGIKPDLIILDIVMPGLSGFQVCTKIRKLYQENQLPIIFVSASILKRDISTSFKCGGNCFLSKPVKKTVLLACIHNELLKITS